MKKNNLITRLTIFGLAFGMLSVISCSKDEIEVDPVNAESAILFNFRTQSPAGIINYMGVYPEIPANPTTTEAVELGAGWAHQVFSYGEHPYTWNGDASTLTKWNVSKTDLSLSEGEVMSFASTGLSGQFSEPVFLSETRALFFALTDGKVVEFNPSEMTISQTHNVTPLTVPEGAGWFGEWENFELKGNNVIIPLWWYAGNGWEIPNKAQVAVFDINTNQVTYHEDNRMLANYGFVPDLKDNQTNYLRPAFDNIYAIHYGGHTNYSSPSAVLKVQEDGSFDPGFVFDIADAIPGVKVINSVPMAYGNHLIVLAEDETYEYPDDPADRWGSSPTSKAYKINMETNEAEIFTAMDDYNLWLPRTTIDGVNYLWARTDPDGVQHSFLVRQNTIDDYTEVSKFVGGQIGTVEELW
ncbi:MAG: hypothetical protein ACOC10_08405 [Bacteroidota bacterium]